MFTNTYQHGWDDALHKQPKPVGMSAEYRDGYMAGERYRAKEKITTLVAVAALSFFMGAAMLIMVAQGVVLAV